MHLAYVLSELKPILPGVWRRSTLKMAFHALVRSKLDYAAPAWQPWLSNANLSSLDHLQNHSLQLITGQLVSTPLEALRLEADV